MEDLCVVLEDFGDEGVRGQSTSLFGDRVSEVCLCEITIASTGDVGLVDTELEFTRCLSVGTFDTGTSSTVGSRAPFLWGDTTGSWFVVSEIVVRTDGLFTTYDTTLVFVIVSSIGTVCTLTTLLSATDSVIDTDSRITRFTTIETFVLFCTV
jgi:hypothetical protein